MEWSQFVVIGENIHCSRAVKRGGANTTTLPDGAEALRFRTAAGERTLWIPQQWACCRRDAGQPMVNSVSLERTKAIGLVTEFNAAVVVSASGREGLPAGRGRTEFHATAHRLRERPAQYDRGRYRQVHHRLLRRYARNRHQHAAAGQPGSGHEDLRNAPCQRCISGSRATTGRSCAAAIRASPSESRLSGGSGSDASASGPRRCHAHPCRRAGKRAVRSGADAFPSSVLRGLARPGSRSSRHGSSTTTFSCSSTSRSPATSSMGRASRSTLRVWIQT